MTEQIRADYKVDLDTRQAKQSLKQLHAKKRKTRQRMTRRFKKVGAFALGAVAGSSNKFITPVRGDNVNPFTESLTPYLAEIKAQGDALLGHSGEALQAAREASRQAFALYVARTGEEIRETPFYKASLANADVRQRGLNLLRQKFPTVKPGAVVRQFVSGRTDLFLENVKAALTGQFVMLHRGFSYIYDGITAK